MANQTYAQKLFERTETLTSLVHERFVTEGKSFDISNMLTTGYMQSFLVNLLVENAGKRETLAAVNTRIEMQREAIARALARPVATRS